MFADEEFVTRNFGAELFSFPPQIWDMIVRDVRMSVLGWVENKRFAIGDDRYWQLLKRCDRILDRMGLNV
ncbi:MAG TPA: hypothetical protein DCO86_02120 [Spirochaetaceae bacterium]|nr:hypothetical protein [Spirochaetaceae bacterium]